MIVEDQEPVGRLLTRLLGRFGYEATVFASAEEALEELTRTPSAFRVIFTDYGLPGMDGLSFVRAAKQITPHTPILISSGGNEDLSPESMGEAGAVGLLEKPFQLGDVERCLNQLPPSP